MKVNVLDVSERRVGDLWFRLPRPGERCLHTGLSRSGLLELVRASQGSIKSVVLKKPGAIRGVRLIHLQSLQSHLRRLARFQEVEAHEQEVAPCEK
jgi:hypothetical protein